MLVESLPNVYDTNFDGAKLVTSISRNGAYLQNKKILYDLTCDVINCTWSIMEQTIANPVRSAIMMHLPPVMKSGIVCENITCLASHFLIGNGLCNDEANTKDCNYDNGDCCGACKNTDHCTDCLCHEEGTLDLSCKKYSAFKSVGK